MPAKSPEAKERKNAARRAKRRGEAAPPPTDKTIVKAPLKSSSVRLFFKPHKKEMSKSELRDMYANAAKNTPRK